MLEPSVNPNRLDEILFDKTLSNDQKILLLQELAKISSDINESIEKKDFSGPFFERDKNRVAEECRKEYPERTWNRLTEDGKKDLCTAYFYSAFGSRIVGDDESTPIYKLGKVVELELKNQLFLPFAKYLCGIEVQVKKNETDNKIRKGLKASGNIRLTLGELLRFIKNACFYEDDSVYAKEFDLFVGDSAHGWSDERLYSAETENFFLDFPRDFRNEGTHGRVYDRQKTIECKNRTREILVWLMDARL